MEHRFIIETCPYIMYIIHIYKWLSSLFVKLLNFVGWLICDLDKERGIGKNKKKDRYLNYDSRRAFDTIDKKAI